MPYRLLATLSLIAVSLAATSVAGQDAPDSDPKQRARAARDLGRQGSGAIGQLKPYLTDAELDVRVEAVKSLVNIGTQHSLDSLIAATRDSDPEIQMRATDGLVNFYLPGYVEGGMLRVGAMVRSRLSKENSQVIEPYVVVRDEVVAALGTLARGGSSMESRANAARAVGILRGKAAVPDLVQAIRSKDDTVMYESLIALQKIRDPQSATQIAYLLRDLNERIQIAAIETTGLLGNKAAVTDLRQAYERARNIRVRRAILYALSMLPESGSRPLFLAAFKDKDEHLRAAGAEGLGRLNEAADEQPLSQAFADENKMRPRLALAFALANKGNTGIAEFSPLQYLVNSLNSRQYRAISEAYLIELSRQPGVRDSLHTALQKGTKDEKIGVGRILAVSGDAKTIPFLEPLTKDNDTEIAQESLRALRSLKARLR